MDYSNFREKVYYISLKDILFYSVIITIIFSFSTVMFFFHAEMILDLFNILALIISMILLMFSIHLKTITGKKIYDIIKIYLLINCIIQMIVLTPSEHFKTLQIFLKQTQYSEVCNFRIINRILVYYILTKYREKNEENKIMYMEYVLLFIILTLLIYINSFLNIKLILIICVSILLIISCRYTYKNKMKDYVKVDLLNLNIILTTIDYVIKILATKFFIYNIDKFSDLIMQIVFISTLIAIIVNITKENYNFIFKETIDTNKHLEYINREIIKNNYKLEEAFQELKDKQSLYKEFLEKLPNPIVIINDKSRIIYCNPQFLNEIKVKNLRQVVNKKIDNYIDFKYNLKKLTKDYKNLPKTSNIKINNKKMESRLFDLDNEELEYIILFKDLTEEIKLSEIKEEFENIKVREEIKKNFLSNISHDLKIPVNVIYSAIQLEKILIDNNDIEKIKMYNEISKQNCFILTKFTNNLIDISKIDSENLEVNFILENIVKFVEDYIYSLSPYINNSGLEISFDTDEEEIYIYFDKEMMQRVILNLISNSIKFTKVKGMISIYIKNYEDYVEIEISDNGIGMSKEFINKAFIKYEMEDRGKNSNSTGFGVGLFVVYNLIKAQSGSIDISSKVGQGTTFIIKLNK